MRRPVMRNCSMKKARTAAARARRSPTRRMRDSPSRDAGASIIIAWQVFSARATLSGVGPLASIVDTGGLKLISRETGVPAIDLAALSLPLGVLAAIPEDRARGQQILPLRIEGERLFVAMVNPENGELVGQLAFVSGRTIVAYAAHPEQLRATIDAVYLARRRGQLVWHGPRVRDAGSIDSAIRRDATGTPPPMKEPFAPEAVYSGSSAPVETNRTRPVVLVVDDEPAIRRMITDALAQRGYDVMVASGGVEAFRLVKKRDPDAILLDAMLPDVHGFDICKRLKASKRYKDIPIIMVTALYKGWRMAADLKEAYGVFATVEKPFDIRELVRALESALAGQKVGEQPPSDSLSAEAQRLY